MRVHSLFNESISACGTDTRHGEEGIDQYASEVSLGSQNSQYLHSKHRFTKVIWREHSRSEPWDIPKLVPNAVATSSRIVFSFSSTPYTSTNWQLSHGSLPKARTVMLMPSQVCAATRPLSTRTTRRTVRMRRPTKRLIWSPLTIGEGFDKSMPSARGEKRKRYKRMLLLMSRFPWQSASRKGQRYVVYFGRPLAVFEGSLATNMHRFVHDVSLLHDFCSFSSRACDFLRDWKETWRGRQGECDWNAVSLQRTRIEGPEIPR